ncbi:uncharacterized protein TNCV_1900291 [Trichonephila clavipes]|nr:uncharacterized protein TNCV_1900291 [Trichonephila clavipes]
MFSPVREVYGRPERLPSSTPSLPSLKRQCHSKTCVRDNVSQPYTCFKVSSSWVAEQFHSDSSLEAVDRRAPNNSKNWQWTTEGDVSARRSTPAPHDGKRPYSFLQAVGSTLVYCYRCTTGVRQFVDVCCTVDCVQG